MKINSSTPAVTGVFNFPIGFLRGGTAVYLLGGAGGYGAESAFGVASSLYSDFNFVNLKTGEADSLYPDVKVHLMDVRYSCSRQPAAVPCFAELATGDMFTLWEIDGVDEVELFLKIFVDNVGIDPDYVKSIEKFSKSFNAVSLTTGDFRWFKATEIVVKPYGAKCTFSEIEISPERSAAIYEDAMAICGPYGVNLKPNDLNECAKLRREWKELMDKRSERLAEMSLGFIPKAKHIVNLR